MNAKTIAKKAIAAILATVLAAGMGTVPALADECGGAGGVPIQHSDCALLSGDAAVEIAVAALPIAGWDEVASAEWSYNFFGSSYRVEVWNTQGRWWIVYVGAKTGEVEAIL